MGDPSAKATVADYLVRERESSTKHEFFDGVVVAMAGAGPRHNQVCSNLVRLLSEAVAAKPCHVFGSDQRVSVEETRSYVYPDLTIACGDLQFTDERPPSLRNPLVVIEVLSPSTEETDRGAKLAHYRRMASVREVLLLQSSERRAEIYRRLDDGNWLIIDVNDTEIEIASVGARVAMAAIHEKTDGLPIDPPAPRQLRDA